MGWLRPSQLWIDKGHDPRRICGSPRTGINSPKFGVFMAVMMKGRSRTIARGRSPRNKLRPLAPLETAESEGRGAPRESVKNILLLFRPASNRLPIAPRFQTARRRVMRTAGSPSPPCDRTRSAADPGCHPSPRQSSPVCASNVLPLQLRRYPGGLLRGEVLDGDPLQPAVATDRVPLDDGTGGPVGPAAPPSSKHLGAWQRCVALLTREAASASAPAPRRCARRTRG